MDFEINSVDRIHWETVHSRQGIIPHFSDFDHSPCHRYPGILPRDRDETGLYYYDPLHHRLVLLRGKSDRQAPDLSGLIYPDPPFFVS